MTHPDRGDGTAAAPPSRATRIGNRQMTMKNDRTSRDSATMGRPMAMNVLRKSYSREWSSISNPRALRASQEAGGSSAGSPREVADCGRHRHHRAARRAGRRAAVALGPGGAIHAMKAAHHASYRHEHDRPVLHTSDRCGAGRERDRAWSTARSAKTADHAVAGTLTLMVGGKPDVVEIVRPVLGAWATRLLLLRRPRHREKR